MYVLAEIGLYAFDPHIQQVPEQALVPLGGFGVGEVDGSGIIFGAEVGGPADFPVRLSDIMILHRFLVLGGTI